MKFPKDVIVIIIIIFIIGLKKQENNFSKVIKLESVYQICFLCFLLFKTIWTVIITFQYICDIKDPLLNLPSHPTSSSQIPISNGPGKCSLLLFAEGQKFPPRFSNCYSWYALKPRPCSCHGELGQHGETWSHA